MNLILNLYCHIALGALRIIRKVTGGTLHSFLTISQSGINTLEITKLNKNLTLNFD